MFNLKKILYLLPYFSCMGKRLIIVRHGESTWNFQHKYTGWVNVPLTKNGINECKIVSNKLLKNNIIPKISYTSELKRCIDSNNIILNNMHLNIDTIRTWRLNERHYGLISGHDRRVLKWQGKYFDNPPIVNKIDNLKMYKTHEYNPIYGESYYMTSIRMMPIWKTLIIPDILNNKIPLICSHKNSIKTIMQDIENIPNDKVHDIKVENAVPIIYDFDEHMNVINKFII